MKESERTNCREEEKREQDREEIKAGERGESTGV